MSDFSGAGDSGGGENLPQIDPTTGQDHTPIPDSLANPFLSKVPEVDRPVLEKYIKDWDAGVTKRFQEIHNQYAPFKGVDQDSFQTAMALSDLINERPEEVFKVLAENLGYDLDDGSSQNGPPSQGFDNPWAEHGIPDEFAQEFMQMQQINEALAARVMGIDNETQEQADQAALDNLLSDLRSRHGNFNETFVLAEIAQGSDPEQAVQAWNSEIQNAINSRGSSKPPPTILGGSGSVPQGGVDPRRMKGEDVRKFIADQLRQANDQSP